MTILESTIYEESAALRRVAAEYVSNDQENLRLLYGERVIAVTPIGEVLGSNVNSYLLRRQLQRNTNKEEFPNVAIGTIDEIIALLSKENIFQE